MAGDDIDVIEVNANSRYFEDIIQLNKTYYEPGHKLLDSSYLDWFYLKNPAGVAKLVFAMAEKELVGMLALIPVVIFHGKNRRIAHYCVNVLSHPEHRGKNIFVRLIRKSKDILQNQKGMLIGHPNENAITGWRRQNMEFRLPLKASIYFSIRLWGKSSRRKIINENDFKSLSLDNLNSQKKSNQIVVDNSWTFIRWRYLECPSKRYDVFVREIDGQVLSLGVTTRYKKLIGLIVHYASSPGASLPFMFGQPLLFMSQEKNLAAATDCAIKMISNRDMPLFVTDWSGATELDTANLSLACSDF